MFKHYFEQIEGIAVYPLISFGIFFLFFLGLLIWVLCVNKQYINTMREKPLEENPLQTFDYHEKK